MLTSFSAPTPPRISAYTLPPRSPRAVGDRKVFVEMPATKKGVLRRLLPNFRAGKVEAEVTYLSNKWRICRANGVTVAFRKTGD